MSRFRKRKSLSNVKEMLAKIRKKADHRPFEARNELANFINVVPDCVEALIMLGEMDISPPISDVFGDEAISEAESVFLKVLTFFKEGEAPSHIYFNLASLPGSQDAIKFYKTGLRAAYKELGEAQAKGNTKSTKALKYDIVTAYMSLAESLENSEMPKEEREAEIESCFAEALKISPEQPLVLQTKGRFILDRSRELAASAKASGMTEAQRQQIAARIEQMRAEAKQLIEAGCSQWVERIKELNKNGESFLSPPFLFTFSSLFLFVSFLFVLLLSSLFRAPAPPFLQQTRTIFSRT